MSQQKKCRPRTSKNRRAFRLLRTVALSFAAAIVGAACEGWEDWDNVFNRYNTGWLTGDGGATIALPGNRLLWTFGDTLMNPMTYQYPWQGNPWFIWGNTVAVHAVGSPQETPPSSSAITFYARNTSGSAASITGSTTSGTKYFRNKTCSGAPTNEILWAADGVVAGSNLFAMTWWIEEGEDPDTEVRSLYFKQNVIQKFTGVTSSSTPNGWTCSQSGVNHFPEQYPTWPPSQSTLSADPELVWGSAVYRNASGVNYIFGVRKQPSVGLASVPDAVLAKVEDADLFDSTKWRYYYKAGTTLTNADGSTGGCNSTSSCWLGNGTASPVGAAIVNGSPLPPLSQFSYNTAKARRDALFVAAQDVATEFSVDRISHSETGPYGTVSGERYVMAHGAQVPLINASGTSYWPPAGHFREKDGKNNYRNVVVRSAQDLRFWPERWNGATYPTSGTIVASTARGDVLAKAVTWPGLGTYGPADPNVMTGYNAYRPIWAVKGQGAISSPGWLTITYWVGQNWICADGTCDTGLGAFIDQTPILAYSYTDVTLTNWKSPFRFAKVPLRIVYPWCKAHFSGGVCQY